MIMKTQTVTLPMFGNYGWLNGEKVQPIATGHFKKHTIRPCERDLALFIPDKVEPGGEDEFGFDVSWPQMFPLSVEDLIENGYSDLFEDLESKTETQVET